MRKAIGTEQAPAPIGPYSQGIAFGNLLFVSGQTPIDPATGAIPPAVADQARRALENVKAIVEAAGATMGSVLKTTVFLKDMRDFPAMNEVYATFFKGDFPARSTVEVARLPKDALVEIEAVAAIGG